MDKLDVLMQQGEKLFTDRAPLVNLWQLLAEHFYPERADFTSNRALGEEFGVNLMSSYPVQLRRDLGDSLSSILRPTNKEWMHTRVKKKWDKVGVEARAWLEWVEGMQRRAMYDSNSMFVRATKQTDHDFAFSGQGVIQPSLNRNADGLLFRNWHLRDVCWAEDETGKICMVFRKAMHKVYDISRWFPKTMHPKLSEKLEKEPFTEVLMWHVVVPSDRWELHGNQHKYASIYIDPTNKHVMEEKPSRSLGYIIPRWSLASGSQYALSPATTVAYADARMLQAMIGVLLEAGEKAVNPPMVANKDIFGGAFSLYPGGTTWADFGGNDGGRIQDSYGVLPSDKNGIPFGLDMARDVREGLRSAFFIDKLSLPPAGQEMTAYEVGQRVQEYIRQAMPLFEPMEQEYNGPLCREVFDLMFYAGAFGSADNIPEELQGEEIEFSFESPLHDAIEEAKAQKFREAKALIVEAVDQDPTVVHIMDFKKALRDVLKGSRTPAAWLRTDAEATARANDEENSMKQSQILEQMQQSADVAKTMGETSNLAQ